MTLLRFPTPPGPPPEDHSAQVHAAADRLGSALRVLRVEQDRALEHGLAVTRDLAARVEQLQGRLLLAALALREARRSERVAWGVAIAAAVLLALGR